MKKGLNKKTLLTIYLLAFPITIPITAYALALSPFWLPIYLFWEWKYFKGERFLELKSRLQGYVTECNEMNQHIESLKDTYEAHEQVDQGVAEFVDNSRHNYQRRAMSQHNYDKYTVNCSSTVLRGARNQPFKYICKYFDIKPTEENLAKFEETLNNFSAAKQGVEFLKNKRDEVLESVKAEIPAVIRLFRKKKLEKKLGFEPVDFSEAYIPIYKFQYVSAGGNKAEAVRVPLTVDVLDRFVRFLGDIVKFRKSAAGQRALMTSSLRQKIKERDNFTCKKCKNNTNKEPNLLLEIDHILPISKGGMTAEDNLQTLCWKCNRTKGAKIE